MVLSTTLSINVDLYNTSTLTVNAHQYDQNTRKLLITITENGVPYYLDKDDMTAFFKFKSAANTSVFIFGEIQSNGSCQ